MVTCNDFEGLLDALVADELPAARRQEVAAHLACCCRCSGELGHYRQVIALARRRPGLAPPSALLDRFRSALGLSPAPPGAAPEPHDTFPQAPVTPVGVSQAVERYVEERVDFIQPVTVVTEDDRKLPFLSRDLSHFGIHLIGDQRLLGQRVRVLIPIPTGTILNVPVRILWTCPVGKEGLVENGGCFTP